jgi:hypothetical protein
MFLTVARVRDSGRSCRERGRGKASSGRGAVVEDAMNALNKLPRLRGMSVERLTQVVMYIHGAILAAVGTYVVHTLLGLL